MCLWQINKLELELELELVVTASRFNVQCLVLGTYQEKIRSLNVSRLTFVVGLFMYLLLIHVHLLQNAGRHPELCIDN